MIELHPATNGDCEFYYQLRNDPDARRNSRRMDPITMMDHMRWWTETADYRWVAWEGSVRRGTIRLGVDGTVSIVVHRLHRGKGYGTQMLKALIPEAKALGFTRIHGEIAPENYGSQKAFLLAGWHPVLFEAYPQ